LPDSIGYDKVLNPSQLRAVMTKDGPLLVIAGAGSGKTRTLVYRVARLVETGVPPEAILLLTFTIKAAGEMLERAAGLADEKCRFVSGGTFHSLAHRVLRIHAGLLGFKTSYTVLDRSDMEELIQSLVQEMQVGRGSIRFPKKSTLANIISKAANLETGVEGLMAEEYAQFLEYAPQVTKLGRVYSEHKKENQLMDYDDLILFFRRLLSENQNIREQLGIQYRYIMVDEYQDTNTIQADIVKGLAQDHRNVMVVGDDAQAIYSFRGANYRNMFDFPKLFPDSKVIKLEQNYRSTQPILNLSNALMDQAEDKYTKCLFTERRDGNVPSVIDARTEPEQAMYVCRAIREHLSRGISLKDMAVLFRAAYHSFELEVELARQGIPFVKYGGFKFMESAHIKDLLAHLRTVVNKEDSISLGRILRLVKNIGQNKSQAIIQWLREEKCHPWQLAEWPGAGKADGRLRDLAELLRQLAGKGIAPKRAIELSIEYYEPILKERFDDFPRRKKDLEQLLPMAGRYQRLRSFLDDLMLEPPNSAADMSQEQRKDCLTLSTVHSAKGLEWAIVFIIWVMDGYFPSAKANSSIQAVEEERRLMYVAATRAKEKLVLCYPGQEPPRSWVAIEDGAVPYARGLSSFIQSLPRGVVEYGSMGTPFRTGGVPSFLKTAAVRTEEETKPRALRPGDRVRHPAFGQGVISKLLGEDKVEVLFRDFGRRQLHLGYTTLERV
jgi:DNA helicase-2/ATP-dependent DNA helicase PcrA